MSDLVKKKIVCDDPRLCYEIVSKPEEQEPIPEGMCGFAPNSFDCPIDKFDYFVPLTEDDRLKTKHVVPLPLSFLQIRQGDIESGIQWYKSHYPKVPDELIEIMARYNFGDLKYATRKSIRNDFKKQKKKGLTKGAYCKALQTKGLTTKTGPIIVDF